MCLAFLISYDILELARIDTDCLIFISALNYVFLSFIGLVGLEHLEVHGEFEKMELFLWINVKSNKYIIYIGKSLNYTGIRLSIFTPTHNFFLNL